MLSYDYYVIIITIIIILIVFIFIFNFIIIIIIIITTIFTWDWSASEFYNTTTAHPEMSIVSLGPATRGSYSRPELYSATTADPETSIVSLAIPEKIASIWRTERDGLSAIKFEAAQLYLSSYVFVAVDDVVA